MIEMRALEQPTVAELIQAARREIALFRHHRSTENTYAWALWQRAIVLRDEQAWFGLYDLYHAVVDAWIMRQAHDLDYDEREALTNEVFAKLYHSIPPAKFASFLSLPALLTYFKRCAASVVVDYRRSQRVLQREDPLESLSWEPALDDFAEAVADQLAAQEVWRVVACEVPAQEERLVLVAVCVQGISPRELQQRYSALFPTVKDIYRIKRNVLERLQRNGRLRALWASQYTKVSTSLCYPSVR